MNHAPQQTPGADAHPLIGTWELVSFEIHADDGSVIHPLGAEPSGLGIYTGQGYVSAQLMAGGRAAERSAPGVGYIAYTGRYEIDEENRTVAHHVECSLEPTWSGTVLRRSYEFGGGGDLLTLRPLEDLGFHAVLVWRRASAA